MRDCDLRSKRASPSVVLFERLGAIALVTLNRPEVHNAIDTSMRDALHATLAAARDDPEVRAVVLRGAGRSFSSGGDVREFGSARSPVAAREARWRRDLCGALLDLKKPTIAAVHGYAVGGGWELALLCDLCIVARGARFRFSETGLGMIPGLGGTQTMTRVAGSSRAMEAVLSGRWCSAEEVVEWGLANACVARDKVVETAIDWGLAIARLPEPLVCASKRLVWDGCDLPLPLALELESRLAAVGSRNRTSGSSAGPSRKRFDQRDKRRGTR